MCEMTNVRLSIISIRRFPHSVKSLYVDKKLIRYLLPFIPVARQNVVDCLKVQTNDFCYLAVWHEPSTNASTSKAYQFLISFGQLRPSYLCHAVILAQYPQQVKGQ